MSTKYEQKLNNDKSEVRTREGKKMKVAIIGSGNSGLAMAAHMSFTGNKVYLWNRSGEHIEELVEGKTVEAMGTLVGTFPLEMVTTDMGDVIREAKAVFVTTPATSHHDLARLMAPHLRDGHIVVLNPGRTFGAVDFKDELLKHGNFHQVDILETQTIIYTCRKVTPRKVNIIALKRDVLISTFAGIDLPEILRRLPDELNRFYVPAESMVETSIGNVGMIFHCAPMLLNTGWVESGHKFRYYREGISRTVADFIENIDKERQEVAKLLKHPVISAKEWLAHSYGLECTSLYECIQSNPSYGEIFAPANLNYRYIYEDIPFGLVPLESMGKDLGLSMRYTGLVIDLANALLGENFRETGRTAEKLHINYKDLMRGVRVEDIEEENKKGDEEY